MSQKEYMNLSDVPIRRFEIYSGERIGYNRVRFFEVIATDLIEEDDGSKSERATVRTSDLWVIEQDGVHSYIEKNYDRLLSHAKEGEEKALANLVRERRDDLLRQTDWTLLRAIEMGQSVPTEWSNYRQALRDITEQEGFPFNVAFPTQPQ